MKHTWIGILALCAAALLAGCGSAPEYSAEYDSVVAITDASAASSGTETTTQTVTQTGTQASQTPTESGSETGTQPASGTTAVTSQTTKATTKPTTTTTTTAATTTTTAAATTTTAAPATTATLEPITPPMPADPLPGDAPPVLLAGSSVSVKPGAAFDLNSLIGYGDDHDPHPSLTYEGTVDTSTPGTYQITAIISDNAGNVTRSNITVNVTSNKPGTSSRPAESFDNFRAAHPGQMYGIDVSKWQGNIDFNRVRNAGAEFVLMRIGFGANEMDQYFRQNFDNAAAAGMYRGVYYFSTANNVDTARNQADWIADQLGGAPLDLPVAFDWENFSHFQDYGMSFDDLNAVYDAFAARLAERGYSTMLYSSMNPLRQVWQTGGRVIWLANYTSGQTSYEGGYYMWQASNTGRIDGISGDVDMNVVP